MFVTVLLLRNQLIEDSFIKYKTVSDLTDSKSTKVREKGMLAETGGLHTSSGTHRL